MSQINSVKAMLDALFERANASVEEKGDNGVSCCKCFVDNKTYIVALNLYDYSCVCDYSFDEIFIYNTEDKTYFIDRKRVNKEWGEMIRKITDFIGCSGHNKLTVSEYAYFSRENLLSDNNIISDSIKQKRSFSICCYGDYFNDCYDDCNEAGREVMLITEFSDDFQNIHMYVHFTLTDVAFYLKESTDTPDLVCNICHKIDDYERELQIRERETGNKFRPQDTYWQ